MCNRIPMDLVPVQYAEQFAAEDLITRCSITPTKYGDGSKIEELSCPRESDATYMRMLGEQLVFMLYAKPRATNKQHKERRPARWRSKQSSRRAITSTRTTFDSSMKKRGR
jgi:hypothetical protein